MTITILSVTGFLLEDDCPAPAPCTCTSRSIDCWSRNLSRVPVFRNTTTRMANYWYLQLNNNSISSLPDDSFTNLKTVSGSYGFEMSLQENNLHASNISTNAFRGIENLVISLNLSDNSLTSIPLAIGSLSRLSILYLDDNPIKSIDHRVFLSIRDSLWGLEISMPNMTKWPDAMHYLTNLGALEIDNFFQIIPGDAFTGFSSTLTDLKLRNANQPTVTLAVCGLRKLTTLSIISNSNMNGKNFVSCNPSLTSLKKLILEDNTILTTFPDIFSSAITAIEISHSGISFIDDSFIPNNTMISKLDIKNNNLTTLPGAVNKFLSLQSCSLQNNKIRLIERHSILNLLHLTELYLDNNPIIFISRDAFFNVPHLVYLGLSGALITKIPLLIETVPSITTLELGWTQIPCGCDLPDVVSQLYIFGFCDATNETINDFVKNYLPQCP